MVGVKDVVFPINEKDYLLIRTFIHGVYMIDAWWQIEQPGNFRWISLIDPLIAYSP